MPMTVSRGAFTGVQIFCAFFSLSADAIQSQYSTFAVSAFFVYSILKIPKLLEVGDVDE